MTGGCKPNPFSNVLTELPGHGKYYSLKALNDPRVEKLPYSIRVLLESAMRNCDEFEVKKSDVEKIMDWQVQTAHGKLPTEIPFKPARVILQDFTGVPALVDLAAMRDAMDRLGGDAGKINPLVPVDLVIDHSVQVDYSRTPEALAMNEAKEFERNSERFAFLKWGASSFRNMLIVPPGSGIVHQVNLEYLARCVFSSDGLLYPDSVVGTDSHTTMIDGLGVVGWGVGGIEAEAVMLGQPISMVLPEVVGFKLVGGLPSGATATDLVLTITKLLRTRGVVGKFVEFFGEGCQGLSLADRATIANMSPEYGATMGYFPVDDQSLEYLRQSGRTCEKVKLVEDYLRAQGLFRTYGAAATDPVYSGEVMELDLATVLPCVSGPKRPHDHVLMKHMKLDFRNCLSAKVGFKGFGLAEKALAEKAPFTFNGEQFALSHGSVVIAAITSCTNTSNPSVMLGAALLAKHAVSRGLRVAPYIKTSLSPGSGVVLQYLQKSGLVTYLEQLGFYTAGLGCQTCIGNSGELDEVVSTAITSHDLVAAAVLSGNRNFEGRVHPLTRANYLASPLLCVAYAIAGTVDVDMAVDPIGYDSSDDGKPVFLKDVWPSDEEIRSVVAAVVLPQLFHDCYASIQKGTQRWNDLPVSTSQLFPWQETSTYIHNPPFFQATPLKPPAIADIQNAYCLLNLGDSITTDHISPAGKIAVDSAAGRYLSGTRNVAVKDFNSYGARRGHDEVMARGTFANIRIVNKLASRTGPLTSHVPSAEEMSIYDAAAKYMSAGHQSIIIAGKEYGSGSSRDWAAKGPYLQGVKAVVAESFERIHRSNLVGMGILPLEFIPGSSADSLGLTGKEQFTIRMSGKPLAQPNALVTVEVSGGKKFETKSRIDTEVEVEYFRHGGILHYVLRKLLNDKKDVQNKT
eukprot:GHVS01091399.1.p1 GENE.GHVS01091399.1~~GHVS01091399.1.p1  ORF type:complete len:910 (-),score=141.66 GHVS01091399.1:355-3084(-)